MEPALAQPVLLGLCPGPVAGGTRWPQIQDEHEAATVLVSLDVGWELAIMSNRPALLGQRWATAEIVVTAADASARVAMHLQQTAAMRAFQRVMQPGRQKAKRTRGARRKPAAKAAASGLAGPAAAASSHSAPAASGPPGSGSSSSTSSESDEDLKESWRHVMWSLRARKIQPQSCRQGDR